MILIDPSKLPLVDGPSEVFNDCPIGFTKEEIDILVKHCGVEAKPIKHGRWEVVYYDNVPTLAYCNRCDQVLQITRETEKMPNYCPKCGSKMNEVEE